MIHRTKFFLILMLILLVIRCTKEEPSKLPVLNYSNVEKQVVEKVERLRADVQGDPTSAAKWGSLGMNLHIHGFKQQARSCYEEASKLDPKEFRWPYFHAILLEESGSNKAMPWFERALQIQPDYAPLLVRVGESLLNQGRVEEARVKFQKATQDHARCSHAYLDLAQIAFAENRLEESRNLLERALNVNPKHHEARNLLATIYRLQKQPSIQRVADSDSNEKTALADPVYARLVDEGVSSYWHRVRGRICLENRQYHEAAREFENALKAKPDAEAYNNLGAIKERLGRFAEAAKLYQESIALQPTALAYCNLGSALGKQERYMESIKASSHAIQLKPDYAEAYLNIGLANFKMERWREAVQALQATVRIEPNQAPARYLLTQCHLALNDRKSAALEFETLRKLNPDLAKRLERYF